MQGNTKHLSMSLAPLELLAVCLLFSSFLTVDVRSFAKLDSESSIYEDLSSPMYSGKDILQWTRLPFKIETQIVSQMYSDSDILQWIRLPV